MSRKTPRLLSEFAGYLQMRVMSLKPESNLEIHAHYYTGSVANQVITINKSELIEFRWFEITQIPKKLAYSQYEIINDLLLIK